MSGNGSLTAFWHRGLKWWTGGIRRFAIAVVLLSAAATAFAGWFTANNLAVDTGTTDMISAETPFRRNAVAFDKAFPQFDDLIVIVIESQTPEGASLAAARLTAALRGKTHLFDRIDWPGGEPYFTRNGLLFFDPATLSALGDRLAEAAPLLTALAQKPDMEGLFEVLTLAIREGSDDPETIALIERIGEIANAQRAGRPAKLSWRNLSGLGGDGRQIVLARAVLDDGSLTPGDAALSEIRTTARRLGIGNGEDVSLRLTGSVALDNEELKSAAVGGKTAALLSLALVTLLLIAGLRSFWLILPAMITLLAGLVWTATFAALTVGHLNLISVAFAVLFVGLGIDFSLHYCLRYRAVLGEGAGDDPLEKTAVQIGGSLALAAFCAALGFLSFLPTAYKGLAELGVISAGGMAIAFLLNLTLLPALLTLFPAPRPSPTGRAFVAPPAFVVLAVILAIAGSATIPFMRFDFNPMNLKDPASESVRTFYDLAADGQNGVYTIDLLAADRTAAAEAAMRAKELPEVGRTVTIDSLIPSDQPDKLRLIEDIAFFLAPVLAPQTETTRPGAADRRAALRSFRAELQSVAAKSPASALAPVAARTASALAALKPGDDAAADLERRLTVYLPGMLEELRLALSARSVTIDDLPELIRNDWIAADGQVRVQLWPAEPLFDNADIRRFAQAVLAAAPKAVGTPVTIAEAGDAVVKAFRKATVIAFCAVGLVLLVVLRRITDTGLVLFPLLLAAIYTGATSFLLGLPFNFANVIVLPLLFGLGVASGVHIVAQVRRSTDTASLMHTSTPRAVLFSALTTIASFGSLALSGHRGMTSMGQLLTVAIAYTLICTLVVLPALLIWLERRRSR